MDGILFGLVTTSGGVPPEIQTFADSAKGLKLDGKPASAFLAFEKSTADEDTAAKGIISVLATLNMPYVPCGYGFGEKLDIVTSVSQT